MKTLRTFLEEVEGKKSNNLQERLDTSRNRTYEYSRGKFSANYAEFNFETSNAAYVVKVALRGRVPRIISYAPSLMKNYDRRDIEEELNTIDSVQDVEKTPVYVTSFAMSDGRREELYEVHSSDNEEQVLGTVQRILENFIDKKVDGGGLAVPFGNDEPNMRRVFMSLAQATEYQWNSDSDLAKNFDVSDSTEKTVQDFFVEGIIEDYRADDLVDIYPGAEVEFLFGPDLNDFLNESDDLELS